MNANARSDFNGYKRTGHRVSLLGIARYCGKAPELSGKYGAGRAAEMSKAFHALIAGDPKAPMLMALLTQEEREKIESWQRPTPITFIEHGVTIELGDTDCHDEELVGLTEYGGYADPNTQDVFLRGYVDRYWIREVPANDGGVIRIAYVCDWKKSEWTTQDGPDDPQVVAYCFAVAEKHECDAFVSSIFSLEEGQWQFGELVYVDSPKARDLWKLVHSAGSNKGGYVTGAHCRGCWARMHCQEHLLPAVLGTTELAAFSEAGSLTPETAAKALLTAQAYKELAEKVIDNARAYAAQGHILKDGDKVYREIRMPGRTSLDIKAAREALGDKLDRFTKVGNPYYQYRWVKEAPEKKGKRK